MDSKIFQKDFENDRIKCLFCISTSRAVKISPKTLLSTADEGSPTHESYLIETVLGLFSTNTCNGKKNEKEIQNKIHKN